MSYRLQDGIEFMKSLPDKSVDGIFTDPPWQRRTNHDGRFDRANAVSLKNAERWDSLLTEMTNEAARILLPNGRCFIWLGVTSVGKAIKAIHALEYRYMFFVSCMPPHYVAGFELVLTPILYFARFGGKWPSAKRGDKRIGAIYQGWSKSKSDTLHPCARPYQNVKGILRDCFGEGDYIIDPFAGSDTTGVACRELNLRYDSCEIDPEMYQTGLDRHSQGYLFEG